MQQIDSDGAQGAEALGIRRLTEQLRTPNTTR
jgi:hypothetical protein